MPNSLHQKERRMSRNIRALISFGDMTGSLVWSQRVNNQGHEYQKLMDKFDAMVTDLRASTGCFVKRLGDGFMVIARVNQFASAEVCQLVVALWQFMRTVNEIISKQPVPRPGFVRIRASHGYLEEKYHADGDVDYRGYNVGMTAKLLRLFKDDVFVCHQSVKEIITRHHAKQNNIAFRKLSRPSERTIPSGVFKEDVEALWTLRVAKPKRDVKWKKKIPPSHTVLDAGPGKTTGVGD